MLLAVKIQEGAKSQEMWAASRSWKCTKHSPWSIPGVKPRRHLNFSPVRPTLGLQNYII